mgnify:CR=1 FL=1
MATTATIDNVTRAVIANNLQWITEEMNEYLVKSAFSSNIKVRRDCSCALYDKEGNMLAQGMFIPVHLGIMCSTLKEELKVHPVETLKEGDALIHNDPYMMGSHLWDTMIFKPIFYEGKLFAFTGSLAHLVDMGGAPVSYVNRTVYEEGLRIPGMKILREGELQNDIIRLITTNVRTPYEVKGDLMAELAANYRGEERLKALAEKYGVETLMEYFDAILDYSEAGMRAAIAQIPDGKISNEDFIEHDGIEDAMIKIKATIEINGSDVFVDLEGTDPPAAGGVNSPWSMTLSGAYYAIKSVLGAEVLTNSGAYRAIHVARPRQETILNPNPPRACAGCTILPPKRLADVMIGAFSQLVPERVCACDADWASATFIGYDARVNRYFSYIETYGAGRGAKYNEDGASGHHTHTTNTANAPTEMIELEHPFIVNEYSLVNDSGGAGKFRGGLGMKRRMTCLTDMNVSLMISHRRLSPYGLFGGQPGANEFGLVEYPDGTSASITSAAVPAGSVVTIQTGGGGGWGNPRDREDALVEEDVLNGYVSIENAKRLYGKTVDPSTLKVVK